MKDSDKKYPFPEPEKYPADLTDYFCPSASWGDMTGLIPYAVRNDSEIKSYNDVYPYLADDADDMRNQQI